MEAGRKTPSATAPGLIAFWTVLLVVLDVIAFLPTLSNGFADYDDTLNFVKNPDYRGVGPAQWQWAWTTTLLGVYQPLSWMLLGLESLLWGTDPRGYHGASIALHAAVVVALYALGVAVLRRLENTRDLPSGTIHAAGAGAALLFGIHPLRVEAVAWASCQPYLPCVLLLILAALAYLRAYPEAETPRRGWLVVCLGMYVAALLFKAVAVAFPAALLALDVYPLRRIEPNAWVSPSARRAWREKGLFLLLGATFMAVAVYAKAQSRTVVTLADYGPAARLGQAAYGACFYLVKTAWPSGLTALYPASDTLSWSEPRIWASALVLVLITAGAWNWRRRWPGWLPAWLAYLAILAPSSGLVRIGRHIAADRYSYAASLPLVLVLAYGLARGLAKSGPRGKWTIAATVGVVTVALGLLTWRQCSSWRDSETLWTRVLECEGNDVAFAHLNLGSTLSDKKGREDEGMAHLVEAVRLSPNNAESHYTLGLALARRGKLDSAEAEFTQALELDPASPGAMASLGLVLSDRGELARAASLCAAAVRLDPRSPTVQAALGTVRARQGKLAEAEAHFLQALRYDPQAALTHQNLGQALLGQGKLGEAEQQFAEAVRLDPTLPLAHAGLARALARQRRLEPAILQFQEAVKLQPRSARLHRDLGAALADHAQFAEAIAHLTEALRLDPGLPDTSRALTLSLQRLGLSETAAEQCASALNLDPNDPAATRVIQEALQKAPR